MSRVLILSDSPYLNTGFATVGRFIGQSLHDAGHEVYHVGFSDPRNDPNSTRWAGRTIPWPVFVNKRTQLDRFAQQSYSQHLLQADPEVIIIVADIWNVDHLLVNAPCPTVLLLHIESEPLPSRLTNMTPQGPKETIIPQILCHANMVITAGPFARNTIQKRLIEFTAIPPKKSKEEVQALLRNTNAIIPDPVDTPVFKPIDKTGLKQKLFKGLKDTDFVIGYFGRQNPRKGLPYALEAFANWADRPDNVYMYLHTALKDKAGWNIPQLLLDLKISEKVILDPSIKVGGGCSDEVLNALYNACFTAGTPVLTSHGYMPIEQIKSGDNVISAEGNTRRVLALSKRKYNGPLVTIKTSRNHVGIKCTPNHKFKVLTQDGIEWKEAAKLEKADIIVYGHALIDLPALTKTTEFHTVCEALDTQHVLVNKKQESYVKVGDPGMECIPRKGSVPSIQQDEKVYIAAVVEQIKKTRSVSTVVYNFEVEEDHSYIVAGMGVKNCNVTVLPSAGEGAGLTLLESSAAGTPTITTEYAEALSYVSGVCELVKPCGFWVEPNTNLRRALPDVRSLTQKYRKFYKNLNYGKELGLRAMARMKEKFDSKLIAPLWDNVTKAMVSIKPKQHSIEKFEKPTSDKTVCFIGTFFVPDLIGGGEITYHKILEEFRANGWDAYCMVCRDGITDEQMIVDGIKVTRTNRDSMERKVARYVEALKPTVIITTLIDPTLTKVALRCGRQAGAVNIYYEQFYNSIVSEYRNVMTLPEDKAVPWGKEVLGQCDLIYSNSAFVQAAMEKYQGFSSKILHPYIAFDDVKVDKWEPEYITMVNPDPGKGGLTLLYTAKNLPDYKFLTVTISDRADYTALRAASSSIPNLTTWKFQKDARKIYEKTKLLIVPTVVDETFGRVILEAQRNGIPVIGRDVGGIKDTMGDGGILIEKHDDDNVWCQTIDKVMKDKDLYTDLSRKASENWKKINYKEEFNSLFKDIEQIHKEPSTRGQKGLCCVFPNFPGVAEVFSNLQKVFPDDVCHVKIPSTLTPSVTITENILSYHPKTVVFGAWLPVYMQVMKQLKKDHPEIKIVVAWFSNFSQMEFSVNNELGIFGELRKHLDGNNPIVDEIWMSSEEDGGILNKSDKRIKPMPCPVSIKAHTPKEEASDDKIKIGLFCTPGPRKNLSNQILAIGQIPNAELHVNGLSQRPEFAQLIRGLNIKVIDHGWMQKEKYLQTLSEMDIGLQVTFAETFNYVVAEFMSYGVPVVTSFMVPIISGNEELHSLAVRKADSPIEIAAKIVEIKKNWKHYSKLCMDGIHSLAKRNNEILGGLIK